MNHNSLSCEQLYGNIKCTCIVYLSLAWNFWRSLTRMSSEETRGESVSSFSISSIPLFWRHRETGGRETGENIYLIFKVLNIRDFLGSTFPPPPPPPPQDHLSHTEDMYIYLSTNQLHAWRAVVESTLKHRIHTFFPVGGGERVWCECDGVSAMV